tara:strand:- start:20 stop:418 length:399 start_codon:yes stop_codon:yes gene_type:complete
MGAFHSKEPVTKKQLWYIFDIFNYNGSPPKTKGEASLLIADLKYHWKSKEPTQKQILLLKKLGYKGPTPKTAGDASNSISKLHHQKGHKITDDDIPYTIYGDHWSEEDPFEHIHEHTEEYYDAKEWRDSLDN